MDAMRDIGHYQSLAEHVGGKRLVAIMETQWWDPVYTNEAHTQLEKGDRTIIVPTNVNNGDYIKELRLVVFDLSDEPHFWSDVASVAARDEERFTPAEREAAEDWLRFVVFMAVVDYTGGLVYSLSQGEWFSSLENAIGAWFKDGHADTNGLMVQAASHRKTPVTDPRPGCYDDNQGVRWYASKHRFLIETRVNPDV